MDNLCIIHRILTVLEESLDEPGGDQKRLTAEALDITENRRLAYLEMLKCRLYKRRRDQAIQGRDDKGVNGWHPDSVERPGVPERKHDHAANV